MKLFRLNKTNHNEVEQIPFKLERNIQNLVEVNTESVFNLKFIKSELTVDKYRIDTLCFDEENNSFVIVEYKKGNSYSVIDQGYTYLQLLLNNKSDFLLVLSQHFNKVLRMEGQEWLINSDTAKKLYGCELLNEDAYEQSVEILFNEEDLSLKVKVVSIQRAYAETLGFLDLTKVISNGYGSCKKL
jgi:hypothetical protein